MVATLKTAACDFIVQKYIEKKEKVDWQRNAVFWAFGTPQAPTRGTLRPASTSVCPAGTSDRYHPLTLTRTLTNANSDPDPNPNRQPGPNPHPKPKPNHNHNHDDPGGLYLGGFQWFIYVTCFRRWWPGMQTFANQSLREKLANTAGKRDLAKQVTHRKHAHGHGYVYAPHAHARPGQADESS